MTTRTDARYTFTPENGDTFAPGEPRPVLRAWGGEDEQSLTMPMGGWMDEDEDAFRAAVQDEARYGAGQELGCIVIERVTYDEDGEVTGGVPFVVAGVAQS